MIIRQREVRSILSVQPQNRRRAEDEKGAEVQSEKMLKIDFAGDRPVRIGDQFGLGRARR